MGASDDRIILISGATGNQGGAAARSLLADGWNVRALTRNSISEKALVLRDLGAEVVQGNMDDPDSLDPAFKGVYGVLSIQNPFDKLVGHDKEIAQGKLMANMAKGNDVQHFVYASAGLGDKDTGVPHLESKMQIEAYIAELGIPATVYRPGPFMELMTDENFYPAVGTWNVMIKMVGPDYLWPWISVDDIGRIIAAIFADKDKFVGQTLHLAGDAKSLRECREMYKNVTGKYPKKIPMPIWLFKRVAGPELINMWDWALQRDMGVDQLVAETRAILPDALAVEDWLTNTL